mmetsp:Transcript_30196/g.92363  ORF Transcript_30196/g.92363 Transcript_30196/m.92363 type:complete len:371 (-) Transcript_30196:209-1321(-)
MALATASTWPGRASTVAKKATTVVRASSSKSFLLPVEILGVEVPRKVTSTSVPAPTTPMSLMMASMMTGARCSATSTARPRSSKVELRTFVTIFGIDAVQGALSLAQEQPKSSSTGIAGNQGTEQTVTQIPSESQEKAAPTGLVSQESIGSQSGFDLASSVESQDSKSHPSHPVPLRTTPSSSQAYVTKSSSQLASQPHATSGTTLVVTVRFVAQYLVVRSSFSSQLKATPTNDVSQDLSVSKGQEPRTSFVSSQLSRAPQVSQFLPCTNSPFRQSKKSTVPSTHVSSRAVTFFKVSTSVSSAHAHQPSVPGSTRKSYPVEQWVTASASPRHSRPIDRFFRPQDQSRLGTRLSNATKYSQSRQSSHPIPA